MISTFYVRTDHWYVLWHMHVVFTVIWKHWWIPDFSGDTFFVCLSFFFFYSTIFPYSQRSPSEVWQGLCWSVIIFFVIIHTNYYLHSHDAVDILLKLTQSTNQSILLTLVSSHFFGHICLSNLICHLCISCVCFLPFIDGGSMHIWRN